jgi:hypothetical protein
MLKAKNMLLHSVFLARLILDDMLQQTDAWDDLEPYPNEAV